MDEEKQTAENLSQPSEMMQDLRAQEPPENLAGDSLAKGALLLTSGLKKPRLSLPEEVLERIDRFNADLKRQGALSESQSTATNEEEQELPSLYRRARRWTDRLDEEKQALYAKSKRNFKLFVLLLLLFGGYFFYTGNFTDKVDLALISLRQKLPLPLDADLALTKVELNSKELRLYVEKKVPAQANLTDEEQEESLSQLKINAAPLCRNESMHKIIAQGKRILVLLETADGSFRREIAIEKCPSTE